jgi:hypothetical protein
MNNQTIPYNLKLFRQWYGFWNHDRPIRQQPVGEFVQELIAQITKIPWGHNLAIISKCKQLDEEFYYEEIEAGMSRYGGGK